MKRAGSRPTPPTPLPLLLFLSLLPLAEPCPAQCRCTPGGSGAGAGGQRVLCPPGQTSLPPGLASNTKSLVIQGRPSPQGSNNVPVLRRGDLAALTALQELTLPFARLADIQDDALAPLAHLQRLCLHNNQLKALTSRTFPAALGKLEYLDLTDNAGCVIQSDAVFWQLTSLKTLYLGGLDLKEVKAAWFRSLSNLESLDLHGNGIQSLENDFLQGLTQMKLLDLTGNDLQSVDSALKVTLDSIQVMYLGENPWHCNCQIQWMKQLHGRRHSVESMVCITPAPLAFRELALVPDDQFKCVPPKIAGCGGPYDVTAGSGVTVECRVEGDPFPTLLFSRPDGATVDTTRPASRFIPLHRTVNSSTVTAADFAFHQGQWSVTANNVNGSDTAYFLVNVFTTTTTTTTSTTTTTTPTTSTATTTPKPTRSISKPSATPAPTKEREPTTPTAAVTMGIWFYVAMAAFAVTALALTSLILVAAVKIRKNRRQVGHHRRDSGPNLGSEADITIIARSPTDLRSRAL